MADDANCGKKNTATVALNDESALSSPRLPSRLRLILQQAKARWLKNDEVYELLANFPEYNLPVSY